MGRDAFGGASIVTLAAMPRLSVARSTGAGKLLFIKFNTHVIAHEGMAQSSMKIRF